MSFRYGGRFVALDNYEQLFGEDCTPDILDEIRSAVLDDTPIADYIAPCGNDSYLLGQIRMALREHVSEEFLDPRLTGHTIYNMRQAAAKSVDMSALLWYITPQKLKVEKEVIETLSEFTLLGVDIRRVDFTVVPKALVVTFCKGLYKGYPMWLLTDESNNLSPDYIRILMRGMELGVDVHQFVRGDWDRNVVLVLFSYNKAVDLNAVLGLINNKFDANQVKTLLDLASAGVPITRLCIKDRDGVPVYNSYQMYEIGESLKAGVDIQSMFNPRLSDFQMAQLREAELAKRAVVQ